MHRTRAHWLILPLLLALSACAGHDPYPYPLQFVSETAWSPQVLAAPPAQDSKLYAHEIDGILARQAKLTAADKAIVAAEDHIRPPMIVVPVLGEKYTEQAYPALFTLLRHSASDAWRLADATQDYWHRDRPWVADDRVTLLVSSITRPSYPSGHTVTNHIWAHVLSELFPARRQALFARAYAIGMHRVDAGVHFPSDVEAGKKFAAALYEKMRTNPTFQSELAAARAELKRQRAPLPRGKAPAAA
ncbi:MAG: phosphatase PAP2 family protein [Alphaproteobacteria bacterium]|nr:phosphatase PAP2 family protein [Alphaproteobacteria bacterium]